MSPIPLALPPAHSGPALTANRCPGAGNLVGLLLSPFILQQYGWRALFYMFGLAGLPLLLVWAAVVPSQAGKRSGGPGGAGAAAPAGGGGSSGSQVGVWQMLSKRAIWAIIIVNFGE